MNNSKVLVKTSISLPFFGEMGFGEMDVSEMDDSGKRIR
jgi:hypothetical protein